MAYINVTKTVNTVSFEEALMVVRKMGINTVTVRWVKNWLIVKYWEGKI